MDKKWGCVDFANNEIIPIIYNNNSHVAYDGYVILALDGKEGMMDKSGVVVPTRYDDIKPFSNGLFAVRNNGS